MKHFSLSYEEIPQDTSTSDWMSQGLHKKSKFYYLLLWDEPKPFFKFGYKLGLQQFKEDFGRLHHRKPIASYVWPIKFEAPQSLQNRFFHPENAALNDFIFLYENEIHKKLKTNPSIKKIPKLLEFYEIYDNKKILQIIITELDHIQSYFIDFQVNSNRRSAKFLRSYIANKIN